MCVDAPYASLEHSDSDSKLFSINVTVPPEEFDDFLKSDP